MAEHCCPWYMAYFFDNPVRRLLYKPEKLFAKYLSEGEIALDVGCGMGYNSIGMARIVGDTGKVYSFDIQQKMLDITLKRASKKGLAGCITPLLGNAEGLVTPEKVDFAVIFWVVHEITDKLKLFTELKGCLKEGAKVFIAEPVGHVTAKEMNESLAIAEKAGFQVTEKGKSIRKNHTAVLEAV